MEARHLARRLMFLVACILWVVTAFSPLTTRATRQVRFLNAVSTNPGKLSDLSLFRQGRGSGDSSHSGQGVFSRVSSDGSHGAFPEIGGRMERTLEAKRVRGDNAGAQSILRKGPSFQQRDAIVSEVPSVLVVAGPGAGKTRVLSARMAYLLESGKCSPAEILVLSYTNSAAQNIKLRTDRLLGDSIATTAGATCNTFHGLCSSILRNNIGTMRADGKDLVIADDSDQMKIMMALLESKGLPASHITATNVLRQIRYWKEQGLGYLGVRKQSLTTWTEERAYELYPDYQSKLRSLRAFDFGDLLLYTLRLFRQHPEVLESYRNQYRHILVDEFQDVSPAQYDVLRMLAVGPDATPRSPSSAAAAAASQDELGPSVDSDKWYANSLAREHQLMRERASLPMREVPGLSAMSSDICGTPVYDGRDTHVFCCGDDDQSIYAFRGATVELMRRFKFDFPSAEVMRLDISYRMPQGLGKAADVFVSKLPDRISKSWDNQVISKIWGHDDFSTNAAGASLMDVDEQQGRKSPSSSSCGAAVEVRCMRDPAQEVAWVAMHVKRQMEAAGGGGCTDYAIAVLARDKHDMVRIREGLQAAGLRYKSRGSGAWVLPSGSEQALDLLRLLAEPGHDLAFESALDVLGLADSGSDGKSPSALSIIKARAKRTGKPYLATAREAVLSGLLKGADGYRIRNFLTQFDAWRRDVQTRYRMGPEARLVVKSVLESAFPQACTSASESCASMARAVSTLAEKAMGYDSLGELVATVRVEDDVVVEADATSSAEARTTGVSNSNSGAGPTVWIMTMHAAKGLEFDEVILPFWVDGNVPKKVTPDERRLAFVSLTRARKRVLISFSKMDAPRGLTPQRRLPSPYIDELMRAGQPVHYEDLSALNFVETLPSPLRAAAADARPQISTWAPVKPPTLMSVDESQPTSVTGVVLSTEVKGEVSKREDQSFKFPVLPGESKAVPSGKRGRATAKAMPKGKKEEAWGKANGQTTALPSKRERRAVKELPTAASLTKSTCRALMKGTIGTKALAKTVLRERLALEGVNRGSIPVKDPSAGPRTSKRVLKALSRCSAEEMGAHLLALGVL